MSICPTAAVVVLWCVLKRRHGIRRSRYKGTAGMRRFVGLSVIADNLINIGKMIAK
jgi:IS5 family transposase